MFRSTQSFGRDSQTNHARARCPRSFNASLEAVEDRTLMSHPGRHLLWPRGRGSVVFGIGSGGSVYMNKDESGFVSLGGNVTQMMPASTRPESRRSSPSAAATSRTSTITGVAGSPWAATSRRSARRRTTRSSASGAATPSSSTTGRVGPPWAATYLRSAPPLTAASGKGGGLRHRRQQRRFCQRQRNRVGQPGRLRDRAQCDDGQLGLRAGSKRGQRRYQRRRGGLRLRGLHRHAEPESVDQRQLVGLRGRNPIFPILNRIPCLPSLARGSFRR